jgi:hypothetical protein
MSITSYLLDDFDVDPETKWVLGVALEKTRVSAASSPARCSFATIRASATRG